MHGSSCFGINPKNDVHPRAEAYIEGPVLRGRSLSVLVRLNEVMIEI